VYLECVVREGALHDGGDGDGQSEIFAQIFANRKYLCGRAVGAPPGQVKLINALVP